MLLFLSKAESNMGLWYKQLVKLSRPSIFSSWSRNFHLFHLSLMPPLLICTCFSMMKCVVASCLFGRFILHSPERPLSSQLRKWQMTLWLYDPVSLILSMCRVWHWDQIGNAASNLKKTTTNRRLSACEPEKHGSWKPVFYENCLLHCGSSSIYEVVTVMMDIFRTGFEASITK